MSEDRTWQFTASLNDMGMAMLSSAILLALFIPLSTQMLVVLPWLRPLTAKSSIILSAFDFQVVMLWVNFALSSRTDPGGVLKDYVPEGVSELGQIAYRSDTFLPVKTNGGPRFCTKCDAFKPPRAHHCRECRRCILRMDHHCHWVNNCIGQKNQAHFFRFLFFTVTSCWTALALLLWRATDAFNVLLKNKGTPIRDSEAIFLAINVVFLVPATTLTSMLLYNQMTYLLFNRTTIEAVEKMESSFAWSGGRGTAADAYNVGWFQNISSVLGDSWYLWLLPSLVPQPQSAGYHFPVNERARQDIQSTINRSSERDLSECGPLLHEGEYSNMWDVSIDLAAFTDEQFENKNK